MPVRNEARYIERSLGSVLAQDYPPDRMDVLVADGGSTDSTRRLIETLTSGSEFPVRVIDNPRGTVAPGLNLAIAEARGEIIVRVDGHCEIGPGHVRKSVGYLQQGFQDGELAGVGGPIETLGETPRARAIAAAMSSRFGVGGSAFRTGRSQAIFADTIPFPAYPKHILEQAGPFDEELVRNQDDEYNYRLRHAGHKLLLAPDLKSRYYSRSGLRSLWRQYYQYGFFKVRVLRKHPAQMSPRQFAPPALVGLLALGAVTAPLSSWGLGLLTVTGGLYLAANLTASILMMPAVFRRELSWPALALMPLIFAALHLGYGSGFLVGLMGTSRSP